MSKHQAGSGKSFLGLRILASLACFTVVVAGLKAASAIMIPIVFALFLSILGVALLSLAEKLKLPRALAIFLTAAAIIGALTGLGLLLGSSVNEFTKALPQYRERIAEITLSVDQLLARLGLDSESVSLFKSLEPSAFMELVAGTLKGLVSALSKTVVVVAIMIFMLIEATAFRIKLNAALGDSIDVGRLDRVSVEVQRYLGIKTLTSGLTGILVAVFVSVMGIDFALLWGLVAFLMNYIPFIGSILASIPALLLALAQLGLAGTVATGIGYLVINIGISNFIEPVFMGRRLGLSPLIVFLSLLFWGWVWGPMGMLLSVPLTMMVKIFLEYSNDFRWLAVLMDAKVRPERDLSAAG